MISYALLLLAACSPTSTDSEDPDGGDGEGDADTDADADGDSDADTDADEPVSALRIEPAADSGNTREIGPFTAIATVGEGQDLREEDVTDQVNWISGNADLLRVSGPGTVAPLGIVTTQLHVSWDRFGGSPTPAEIDVTGIAAAATGDVVINEVLFDPPVDVDVNADGVADAVEDEFVELANKSGVTVDLGGATLWEVDNLIPRHTFAGGTILRAGEAIVVYGGGKPETAAANCTVLAAENEDPDLQLGLALNNDGDTLSLIGADFAAIDLYTWADQPDLDMSFVRVPDVVGETWNPHRYASGAVGDYSPCMLLDGSTWVGVDGVYPL